MHHPTRPPSHILSSFISYPNFIHPHNDLHPFSFPLPPFTSNTTAMIHQFFLHRSLLISPLISPLLPHGSRQIILHTLTKQPLAPQQTLFLPSWQPINHWSPVLVKSAVYLSSTSLSPSVTLFYLFYHQHSLYIRKFLPNDRLTMYPQRTSSSLMIAS